MENQTNVPDKDAVDRSFLRKRLEDRGEWPVERKEKARRMGRLLKLRMRG